MPSRAPEKLARLQIPPEFYCATDSELPGTSLRLSTTFDRPVSSTPVPPKGEPRLELADTQPFKPVEVPTTQPVTQPFRPVDVSTMKPSSAIEAVDAAIREDALRRRKELQIDMPPPPAHILADEEDVEIPEELLGAPNAVNPSLHKPNGSKTVPLFGSADSAALGRLYPPNGNSRVALPEDNPTHEKPNRGGLYGVAIVLAGVALATAIIRPALDNPFEGVSPPADGADNVALVEVPALPLTEDALSQESLDEPAPIQEVSVAIREDGTIESPAYDRPSWMPEYVSTNLSEIIRDASIMTAHKHRGLLAGAQQIQNMYESLMMATSMGNPTSLSPENSRFGLVMMRPEDVKIAICEILVGDDAPTCTAVGQYSEEDFEQYKTEHGIEFSITDYQPENIENLTIQDIVEYVQVTMRFMHVQYVEAYLRQAIVEHNVESEYIDYIGKQPDFEGFAEDGGNSVEFIMANIRHEDELHQYLQFVADFKGLDTPAGNMIIIDGTASVLLDTFKNRLGQSETLSMRTIGLIQQSSNHTVPPEQSYFHTVVLSDSDANQRMADANDNLITIKNQTEAIASATVGGT